MAWHSGKMLASPSVVGLALGEETLPRELRKALGEEFFFSFFAPFFSKAFPHYLKLLSQVWENFNFF